MRRLEGVCDSPTPSTTPCTWLTDGKRRENRGLGENRGYARG